MTNFIQNIELPNTKVDIDFDINIDEVEIMQLIPEIDLSKYDWMIIAHRIQKEHRDYFEEHLIITPNVYYKNEKVYPI